jgi:hypothetical protein
VSDPKKPPTAKHPAGEPAELVESPHEAPLQASEDLPVVARMVIEIRSDGSRTVARGALEDVVLGQRVAVQAEGSTPLALAISLARSMVKVPSLARGAARALLAGRRGKPRP